MWHTDSPQASEKLFKSESSDENAKRAAVRRPSREEA